MRKNPRNLTVCLTLLAALLLIASPPAGTSSTPATSGWKMHEIDNPNFELPNGLDAADLNGDGFDDYLTNYERTGEIRVAFHPGLKAVKERWPAVTIARFDNAESAAFGDLDGDGLPDIAVAHGSEEGSESGVSVIWSPGRDEVKNADAWVRSEAVPGTIRRGHYLYIKTFDVNGDGNLDIVVGGRRQDSEAYDPGGSGVLAGLKWIESPGGPPENIRDMTKWKVHDIDPTIYSGYGFVFVDLDNDGDQDIVLVDSDWDTPEHERKVVWYENPGNRSPEQRGHWRRNVLYRGSELYTKPQIGVGDLTGNGYNDFVVQTDDHVYLFKNLGRSPVTFRKINVKKPLVTQHRARPTRIVDINGDGRMDIVGMLIHNEGYLPKSKAAVFWMEYTGILPVADNWRTHIVKMGDGYDGRNRWVGEKWDQMLFRDVDRDGDLDIVANCEEYHKDGVDPPEVTLAVVWFENPGN